MKAKVVFHFICIFGVLVFLAGCASGSVIITGVKRDPINPINVKLYTDPPSKYETIGIVSASSDSGFTEQGSVNYAIEELKKQAAKIGANAIILSGIGETKSNSIYSDRNGNIYSIESNGKTISGKAIYLIE